MEEKKVRKREAVHAQTEVEERLRQMEAVQKKKADERTIEQLEKEAQAMQKRKFICVLFIAGFLVALYAFIRVKIAVKREYVF